MATWDPRNGVGGIVGGNMGMGMFVQPQSGRSSNEMQTLAYQGKLPTNPYGSSGAGMTIESLLNMQRTENARNRDLMEANWQEGKSNLYGVMPGYDSDPMNTGARGLAQGLLNNPEAINDQTQSQIRSRLQNMLGAQADVARRRGMASLSSQGMMNPAAMGRMNERLGRAEDATLSRSMADTEIERALRKNQDIQSAAGMGRQLGMDRAGLSMDVNKTYLDNMPTYRPEDLSGMAALINKQTYKPATGYSSPYGSMQNQGNSMPSFGFNTSQGLQPWGPNSPGQTGFSPGLRGEYQWTGQYQPPQQPQYQGPSQAWYQRQAQPSLDAASQAARAMSGMGWF